jgi:hypothetical protein
VGNDEGKEMMIIWNQNVVMTSTNITVCDQSSIVVRFASKSVNMKLDGVISDSFYTSIMGEKATDSYYRRVRLTRILCQNMCFQKKSYLNYHGFHNFSLGLAQ